MRLITDVAFDLGLSPADLLPYGPYMAKVTLPVLDKLWQQRQRGKLILVSAINPTRFGEGKTTVSIGLAQGMRRLHKRVALALREPSLGPIFGIKGGGTGGGACRLEPSDRINLHFTGDLHAITAANNLLAAMLDNAINFRAEVDLDHRQVKWRRVIDMNDRFLRKIVIGLGGQSDGVPREDSFDITAASEVMAILCLSHGIADLKARLSRIWVGFDRKGRPATAGNLRAAGAMAALLYDAILPNLVQTTEGCPAFVHGGPFGNIAHGCNSVMATRTALGLADYVVTEAGFGFDLGAEKFFDIKCRSAGLWPSAVVLVVTARALRVHGTEQAQQSNPDTLMLLERGFANLEQHVDNARTFGFEPTIAINVFPSDTEVEVGRIEALCRARGLKVARFHGFAQGGLGSEQLATCVLESADGYQGLPKFLYELDEDPVSKINKVASAMYGAKGVLLTRDAKKDIERIRVLNQTALPVCIAKTHLSLSDDSLLVGRPADFQLTVRGVRVAAGAGYLLALAGDITTMPGLPAAPAAHGMDLTDDGQIVGIG